MAQAIWNNQVIAESDDFIRLEGNLYFPKESINKEFVKKSTRTSQCFWKGEANYLDLEVNGKINKSAAWYYKDPLDAALNIKNFVAFWKGVKIKS